jgi:hypothetical protein
MIILIFFLFFLTRLVIYLGNPVPTGYDAGIYLHIMKTFPVLDQWLRSGFSPGVFVLTYPFVKLGISPESLLVPLSLISQVVLFIALYIAIKTIAGKKAALWTAFLLTVAPIQYRMFWYFYIKNTFGLAFLLLTIAAVSKRSLVYAIIFGALVVLFHLPTALVLALILAVEFVIHNGHRLFYVKTAAGIALISAIYYLPHFNEAIAGFIPGLLQSTIISRVALNTLSQPVYGGAFYTLGQSLPLMLLYGPAALWALYLYTKGTLKEYRTLVVAFLITLTLVMTHFSFYQRFIIPLDLFAICLGGTALSKISSSLRFYCVICIAVLVAFIYKTGQPLISASELSEIRAFKPSEQTYILSTAKEDPAWLLGYTNEQVVAWDFGGYNTYWTNSQWQTFFSTPSLEEKISLLKLLPTPVYLYINDKTKLTLDGLDKNNCLTQVSSHFYHFICSN